jgi:hypothetical protein
MLTFLHCCLNTSHKIFQSVEYIYPELYAVWCQPVPVSPSQNSEMVTILATYATAYTFTAFEPCHWFARTGFVSLWGIHVSDKLILPCCSVTCYNKHASFCLLLLIPALENNVCYQQFSCLKHFAIKKHNIYIQSSSYQIIVQWNRLILLEGPDLPSILLTVSVT